MGFQGDALNLCVGFNTWGRYQRQWQIIIEDPANYFAMKLPVTFQDL